LAHWYLRHIVAAHALVAHPGRPHADGAGLADCPPGLAAWIATATSVAQLNDLIGEVNLSLTAHEIAALDLARG
jgi:hypothetical protein